MIAETTRIVYLINGLSAGGAEMMLYRLLEKLDRKKYDPVVVTLLKFPGPLQAKIEKLGIDVHLVGVNSKLDLSALGRLYRILKALKPDILHTQLFGADMLGRLTGRMLKVPVIITGIRNIYYGSFSRYLFYRLTEWCSFKTIFVCRAAQERFIELRILPESKAEVIYNGLDSALFYSGLNTDGKKEKRKELDLPNEDPLILAVGSLTRQKGYGILFKALDLLKKREHRFKLVIAGTGYLKDDLRNEVIQLDLEEQVAFLGRSDLVPELMASSDFFVLSSIWEGLPGVILEAMASELPVVATAVGGTPELVIEGKTGYLVPPADPEKLAGTMEKMLKLSKEKKLALGRNGRSRVEEKFSLNKMVKAYENLYETALKKISI